MADTQSQPLARLRAEKATTEHTTHLPEALRPSFKQMRWLRVLDAQAQSLGQGLVGLSFYGEDLDDPTDPYVTGVYRADRETGEFFVQGWQPITDMIDHYLSILPKARQSRSVAAQAGASAPRFRLDPESGQMVQIMDQAADRTPDDDQPF